MKIKLATQFTPGPGNNISFDVALTGMNSSELDWFRDLLKVCYLNPLLMANLDEIGQDEVIKQVTQLVKDRNLEEYNQAI